ncbi:MAG: FAD-dependent oxidoreductase [Cyclobacteriaceae bacterium]|jgi:D-amino-acid dehydrogenase|nr:FAD-dependent oxidoreductase [Cyclobacteriaceae bacterium]
MKVAVIGGGIIGLCSAYYLKKAGHDVLVFDQSSLEDGCSIGNAGMVVPSHIIPLAAPGMVAKGIRWMFDSQSPFYVRPRFDFDLLRWGLEFYRHANPRHVARSIPALKELSLLSKACYQQLVREVPFDFAYHERGLLMLYQTQRAAHEEAETADIANRHGVKAEVLSAREVQALEPNVRINVRGGVFYPGDAHLTPSLLMRGLREHLQQLGVRLMTSTEVRGFVLHHDHARSVCTAAGDHPVDSIVLAAGSWSGAVARQLHLRLPMQAGKGYGFTLPDVKENVRIPSILLEARVAVTPMGSSLRFGGTLEITGIDHTIHLNRVRGIVQAIPRYYPEMSVSMPKKEDIWHGLRPCSPDGLPYLGRLERVPNVIVATGHAMMGLSLAPGTGKLVAELVENEKPSMNLSMFAADRFTR